jgi:hypothetical protein
MMDSPPPFSHRAFGPDELRSNIKQIYSEATVAELCSTHGINEPGHVTALWDFLSFAATVYLGNKAARDDRPRPGETKSKLAVIEKLARELRSELDGLGPQADYLLWSPEQWISTLPITDPVIKTEFGLTVVREEIDERTHRLLYLERADILESLDVLENYARHGIGRLPTDKGSRPPLSSALLIWMTNAQSFWEGVLGRQFTRGMHGSEGVTKASRFCIDALRPLAPKVKRAAIDTAMKRVIKQKPKRVGPNPLAK